MLSNFKRLVATLTLGVLFAGFAQASTYVDFLNINDTNHLDGFSVAGTQVNTDDRNILDIDVSAFFLEVVNGDPPKVMFDTLSFNIVAPDNFFIRSVKYSEGLKTTVNGGTTISHGSISVNGVGQSLGVFSFFNPNLASTPFSLGPVEILLDNQVTSAFVAITNSLTAVGGIASVHKGFNADGELEMPSLEVTLQAVPVPAAVWLFGSALVGFVTFSRRRAS